MELTEIQLKSVAYFIDKFTISVGATMFDVPRSMISQIQIDKRFISMVYPLYQVTINVPIWLYTEMVNDKDNIHATMSLQYRMASENEGLTNASKGFTTELNGRFKVVIPYTTPVPDSSIQNQSEKEGGSYKNNYEFNQYAIMEISLYNIAAHNASKNTINMVLSGTTISSAMVYCFNRLGISNVLMSNSDNYSTIGELTVAQQTGLKAMVKLIEDYKFHNEGSILFFDLVEGYLIGRRIGCQAWRNNEYKTTYFLGLTEFSDAMGRFTGAYVNHTEKFNVVAIEQTSYSFETISDVPSLNETGQPSFIKIVTDCATMGMLSPNKEFIVNIDSADAKKINGKYAMHAYSLTLRQNGEIMLPFFEITLRK